MSHDSETGWGRAGQDEAETQHPPPQEPQCEPKMRMWPVGRFLLLLLAFCILWAVIWVLANPKIF